MCHPRSAGKLALLADGGTSTTEFFDKVVAINVIEHVYSAIDFLTAMYSTLKRGILVFREKYFEDPDKDALPS